MVRSRSEPDGGRGAWTAGALGLALVTAWLVTTVPTGERFWLVALWASWILSFVWLFVRRSFSLATAGLFIAMLLFVVQPATAAVLQGHVKIAGYNFDPGAAQALRIATLAQVSLWAGVWASQRWFPRPSVTRLTTPIPAKRLETAAVVSIGAAILATLAFAVLTKADIRKLIAYTSGGYHSFTATAAPGSQGAYLLAIQLVAGMALILLPLRLALGRPRGWLLSGGVALLASGLLLAGAARGRFLVPALAALLVWLKTSKRMPDARVVAVVGTLGLIVLTSVVGVARGATGDRSITPSNLVSYQLGSGSDLWSPIAGLAEHVPSQQHFLHGTSYLEMFVFPVPRAIWHNKPQGATSTLVRQFDPGVAGLAFPEFGEAYANFGMLGVALASFVVALLAEWLWGRLARASTATAAVGFSVCFSVLAQVFVRGAIAPMVTQNLILLVLAVPVTRWATGAGTGAGARPPARSQRPAFV